MTHGVDLPGAPEGKLAVHAGALGLLEVALNRVNRAISFVGMVALLAASLVLTYSVVSRYFFKAGTDWQDEAAVFCIVGAVFLAGAWVQAQRGHIGIEARGEHPSGQRQSHPRGAGRPHDARVLRVLRVEVVDAVPRGVGRQDDDVVDVRAAAHDSLRADGGRHVAAGDPARAADRSATSSRRSRRLERVVVEDDAMSVLSLGLLFGGVTLVVMFSGMPIAFALGFVAMLFMAVFMPASSLDTVTQNVYEEMASITLLSIPLFILKGAAIGRSNAGRDLYLAMHAWMQRIPGGLGIANVFTCALFAAMAGSSPATCSAIGSAGIPEMRDARLLAGIRGRHHRRRRHAGHPAAAVDHDDPLRGRGGGVARPAVPRRHRARDAAGRAVRAVRRVALPPRVRGRARGVRERRNAFRVSRAEGLHAAREGRDAAARACPSSCC